MTDSYDDILRQHRRLLILQLLSESNDYRINELILKEMVGYRLSAVSLDVLRSDLYWLKDQGLVELEVHADLHIPKITHQGLDVANGAVKQPGVSRPGPAK